MGLLSWLPDDLLNTLCQFPSDSVFFFVNDFSFILLCSVVPTEHNGIKEKQFTKKKAESLGNWQSVFSSTDHQGSQDQDGSPPTPYTAAQREELKPSSKKSHI
jgi:hypothetical protein